MSFLVMKPLRLEAKNEPRFDDAVAIRKQGGTGRSEFAALPSDNKTDFLDSAKGVLNLPRPQRRDKWQSAASQSRRPSCQPPRPKHVTPHPVESTVRRTNPAKTPNQIADSDGGRTR